MYSARLSMSASTDSDRPSHCGGALPPPHTWCRQQAPCSASLPGTTRQTSWIWPTVWLRASLLHSWLSNLSRWLLLTPSSLSLSQVLPVLVFRHTGDLLCRSGVLLQVRSQCVVLLRWLHHTFHWKAAARRLIIFTLLPSTLVVLPPTRSSVAAVHILSVAYSPNLNYTSTFSTFLKSLKLWTVLLGGDGWNNDNCNIDGITSFLVWNSRSLTWNAANRPRFFSCPDPSSRCIFSFYSILFFSVISALIKESTPGSTLDCTAHPSLVKPVWCSGSKEVQPSVQPTAEMYAVPHSASL